jgi:6-phosphofructokinase 1
MAGKTKLLVSYWNNHYVHVPMEASAGRQKRLDPNGRLWQSVLEATGQDVYFGG